MFSLLWTTVAIRQDIFHRLVSSPSNPMHMNYETQTQIRFTATLAIVFISTAYRTTASITLSYSHNSDCHNSNGNAFQCLQIHSTIYTANRTSTPSDYANIYCELFTDLICFPPHSWERERERRVKAISCYKPFRTANAPASFSDELFCCISESFRSPDILNMFYVTAATKSQRNKSMFMRCFFLPLQIDQLFIYCSCWRLA